MLYTVHCCTFYTVHYLSYIVSCIHRRGLLTRRELSAGPEFGITMDAAPSLDGFHVVFGTVLEGFEVLDAIAKIPTYTYKTQTGRMDGWLVG
jgi:cyclophilin family peptidyl-prolyl cis-trans isomerase